MVFDKFDPAIWIPAQRLLEMSKWVGQGAEAASLPLFLSISTLIGHPFATPPESIQDLHQVSVIVC
jgi:hypothetical protein